MDNRIMWLLTVYIVGIICSLIYSGYRGDFDDCVNIQAFLWPAVIIFVIVRFVLTAFVLLGAWIRTSING